MIFFFDKAVRILWYIRIFFLNSGELQGVYFVKHSVFYLILQESAEFFIKT